MASRLAKAEPQASMPVKRAPIQHIKSLHRSRPLPESAIHSQKVAMEDDEPVAPPPVSPRGEEEDMQGKTLVDFQSLSISGTFELFPENQSPRRPPFDPSTLRELIVDKWRISSTAGTLGSLGGALSSYYISIEDEELDVKALQKETLSLISSEQEAVAPDGLQDAFFLFANIHRFYTLLTNRPFYNGFLADLSTTCTSSFEWLIQRLLPSVLEHFKTLCEVELGNVTAQMAVTSIVRFRGMFKSRIGEFVWSHLTKAIDCELANQLVSLGVFKSIESMLFAKKQFIALERIIHVATPFFFESIEIITNYEKIIAESKPFENYGPHIPPDFLVALVFMSKKKALIPLEISDKRILGFAEYMKVDLTKVTGDTFLCVDESVTTVPVTVWDA